jgi:hypothetical protein
MTSRDQPPLEPSIVPSTAFTHPLFAIALVTLVLNDHVLKGAGILPGMITGKVSDFAGLLVAPAVLAWVARVRSVRGWIVAHVIVGAGFTALELSPGLVSLVERASASAGFPLRMWPDPSDLLALPMLAVSCVALRSGRRRPDALIGAVALVACTATSAQPPAPRYPYRPRGVVLADVIVRHDGSDGLEIEVRRLRDEADIDCDALMEGPQHATRESDFRPAQRWTLARGDGVPLWDRLDGAQTRECYAVRLSAHGHEWILAWRHGAPPLEEIPLRLEPDAPAEENAVIVRSGGEHPRVPAGVVVGRP